MPKENIRRIKELSQNEFWEIYRTQMKQDFPKSEIRREDNFENLWRDQKYLALGWYEEKPGNGQQKECSLTGYAFFVIAEDAVLLDYFAVLADQRGNGSGGRFLEAMKTYFAERTDCILLEVENPEYAVDENDRKLRERRIAFYERHGVFFSKVETRVFTDEYLILVLPVQKAKEHPVKEWAEQIKGVYESIFPYNVRKGKVWYTVRQQG
ncbi:hypothetical protein SAMN02745243_03512 [Hespellia stercorisuis DSM 15480]|uniref:N-acetyltransferase domain-containing protein n=2 Tax=Hespellia stercorisuis TaxID=180311 RepID=A0A1M6UIK2_9FIRM|nr:hypothetical protein SAMN02745243_03512 [Hespellia stercorisuis DSM 15480]